MPLPWTHPPNDLRSRKTFVVPSQGGITFPDDPASSTIVTITFPVGSTASTGLHWHETHTEYIQIIHGRALLTLGSETLIITAKDGVVTVPRYVKHAYRRAPDDPESEEEKEDLVLSEWTDPDDGEKLRFFRNVIGLIWDLDENAGLLAQLWLLWGLFVAFEAHDNFPVLLKSSEGWFETGLTKAVLKLAVLTGYCVGLRGEYKEYTPDM